MELDEQIQKAIEEHYEKYPPDPRLGTVPDAKRLNIGCGRHPLHYWCNIDNDPSAACDMLRSVPPIPYPDDSMDEIYAGHFLEHLTPEETYWFLLECHRVLKPGGLMGVVVPDFREIVKRYLDPSSHARMEYPYGIWHDCHDLNEVCSLFLYSTVQESGHKWMYDMTNLRQKLETAGFKVTGEINRWMDRRISVGAWYQFGLDAVKV